MNNRISFDTDTSWEREVGNQQKNFRFNIITIIVYIIGIILIATKIRKSNEYIPFGPFIVIAAFICMFVPIEILLAMLITIFTLGMYQE